MQHQQVQSIREPPQMQHQQIQSAGKPPQMQFTYNNLGDMLGPQLGQLVPTNSSQSLDIVAASAISERASSNPVHFFLSQGIVSCLHIMHYFYLISFFKGLINAITDKGLEIGSFSPSILLWSTIGTLLSNMLKSLPKSLWVKDISELWYRAPQYLLSEV